MHFGVVGKMPVMSVQYLCLNSSLRYRNFLMACAALMSQVQQPMYFPLLDAPLSPSIRNLQTWIETAWKEG